MFQFLLDILFPQKPLVRELLALSPEEFVTRATRSAGRAGDRTISLFAYHDPLVREAILMLKYRGNKKVAALLASALHDELLGFLEEYAPLTNFTEPLLVPIPLSRKRERERGFNQCILLIDELEELDGGRNFTITKTALRKIKDTPSQTKTESRAKRLENLRNCFSADPNEVGGRNIILIDDVATTGATLAEARRALRRAGARKVIAFTIAH